MAAIDARLVCHLLCQHVDYLANGYCTEVFTRSGAHSRRAGLYFTIADYQHVRHLLQLGLPDLRVHPVVRIVNFNPQASCPELRSDLMTEFVVAVCDRHHHCLHGCHPQREGSGEVFDWSLAEGAPGNRPMLLAGGLDPGNVASAIKRVAPYGVDVSSGVESRPGRRDPRLLRLFIEAARGAKPASGAYEGSRRPPFDWETQT